MIELEQIVNYLEGFNGSVIEGNTVLRAKHLFDVGKVAETQDTTFKIRIRIIRLANYSSYRRIIYLAIKNLLQYNRNNKSKMRHMYIFSYKTLQN